MAETYVSRCRCEWEYACPPLSARQIPVIPPWWACEWGWAGASEHRNAANTADPAVTRTLQYLVESIIDLTVSLSFRIE